MTRTAATGHAHRPATRERAGPVCRAHMLAAHQRLVVVCPVFGATSFHSRSDLHRVAPCRRAVGVRCLSRRASFRAGQARTSVSLWFWCIPPAFTRVRIFIVVLLSPEVSGERSVSRRLRRIVAQAACHERPRSKEAGSWAIPSNSSGTLAGGHQREVEGQGPVALSAVNRGLSVPPMRSR